MMDRFNTETLAKKINEIINIDFDWEPLTQENDKYTMDKEAFLKKEIEIHIMDRIEILSKEAKYFLFEPAYVETEWKDMISVHYINTSYKVDRNVMRVHLFKENCIDKENYLGFFTLRTIDEIRYMISYIYPNWENIKMNEPAYIMTYEKCIHIGGRKITFLTYPLLAQDNMVISCAQASIISFGKYLHNKYDFKQFKVSKINANYLYGRKKVFPSKGLEPLQMLEIISNNDIGVDYNAIHIDAETNNT